MRPTLLFDLDGTLVDCDDLHQAAWATLLKPHRITVDATVYKREIMGYPNHDITARLLPRLSADEGARIAEAKEDEFRRLATHLEPVKGLTAFLDLATGLGLPMGVVTNATRLNAEIELAGIGLATRFDTVVIGYECEAPKPDPAPYLEGLRRLDGAAATSLAFEDSLSGLRAARGAGLAVIGLATGLTEAALVEAGAAFAIRDYTDPRLVPFLLSRTGLKLAA